MKRETLWFTAPGQVEIREEEIPPPGPGELLIQTVRSGISAGTELLIYRGEAPRGMAGDLSISGLRGEIGFPMKYGYTVAGRVAQAGVGLPADWEGREVFSFHPHESFFLASPEEVRPIPPGISPEEALLFPSLETALNLIMDGRPLLGEQAAVLGQGMIGLLVTALLSRFSLSSLVTFDPIPRRRSLSLELGARASLDPFSEGVTEKALGLLQGDCGYRGADLTFEVSGNPDAFHQAVLLTGYSGRILLGSWYGNKPVAASLGGTFHRSRIRVISSQVSTIAPELTGCWNQARRGRIVWQNLRGIRAAGFITHRFPLAQADRAYRLLAAGDPEALQVIFTY